MPLVCVGNAPRLTIAKARALPVRKALLKKSAGILTKRESFSF
jgi:hypothetical protein